MDLFRAKCIIGYLDLPAFYTVSREDLEEAAKVVADALQESVEDLEDLQNEAVASGVELF